MDEKVGANLVEKTITEHVLWCEESNLTVKDLEDGTRMGEIVELFRKTEEKRRTELINEK